MNETQNQQIEAVNNPEISTKVLLRELAQDIATEYHIQTASAEKLIQSNALKDREALQKELANNTETASLSTKQQEELFYTIQWAKEIIAEQTSIKIETLKDKINIDKFTNDAESYFPTKLLKKAKNPQKPHEHVLWIALGSANSIIKTAQFCYEVWKWFVQTPYHIYLLVTKQAQMDTNSIKKI